LPFVVGSVEQMLLSCFQKKRDPSLQLVLDEIAEGFQDKLCDAMDAFEDMLAQQNFPKAKIVANEASRVLEQRLDVALDRFELFVARNVFSFDEAAARTGEARKQSSEALKQERLLDKQLEETADRYASAKRLRGELATLCERCEIEDSALQDICAMTTPAQTIQLRPVWEAAGRVVETLKTVKQ
jgi:hypothetical protein